MRIRGLPVLAAVLLTCALAAPASAALSPYVRLDYGGTQLRMTDGNNLIRDNEAAYRAAGLPADFNTIGSSYGPSGAVGLWVLPGLRVGATYAYGRSVRHNRLHVPGVVWDASDLDFRMTEIGGEAAVRFRRLAGLTFGATVAQGRAEMIEGYAFEDFTGWPDNFYQYYQDDVAKKTRITYGGYIGLDQTNEQGVAGFIRAGFVYRDMGHMPTDLTISDGTNTVQATGQTIWLDYSGFYVKAGIGYDLVH